MTGAQIAKALKTPRSPVARVLSVQWVDSKTLEVTVPQGFPAGPYSVTVVDGYGAASAPLAAGCTILSEAQFSATLAVDHAAVNVGQNFTVTATLTNRVRRPRVPRRML